MGVTVRAEELDEHGVSGVKVVGRALPALGGPLLQVVVLGRRVVVGLLNLLERRKKTWFETILILEHQIRACWACCTPLEPGLLEQGVFEEVEEGAEVLLRVLHVSVGPGLPLVVVDVFAFRSCMQNGEGNENAIL